MDLTPTQWILGGCAAALVGFSKTGVPGLGILIVPLMAAVFPAKASVGALLPMLVTGDIFAIVYYRRHAQWSKLWGLFPLMIVGIAVGTWTLLHVTDEGLKPLLGWIVMGILVLDLARTRLGWTAVPHHWLFVSVIGFLAGFTTTVGNVAGSIMSIYLISRGLEKDQFLGTGAWYYGLVNAAKFPLFWGLGMISVDSLRFNGLMLPAIALGAVVGRLIAARIPQRACTGTVLVLAALAALRMIFF